MKVGTINYASYTGLGVLVKEFWDNEILNDILVIKHPWNPSHHEKWYPTAGVVDFQNPSLSIIENYIKQLDVLFLFETGFFPEVLSLAKKYKVKTILMPMYEWSPFPQDVDLYIAPSQLDYDYYKSMYPNKQVILLPVPANSQVKWKLKEKAYTFTHNAGNGSSHDRNGTQKLIEALPFIKSPIKLKIKAQPKVQLPNIQDPRVEIINKHLPFHQLWEETDVFIFVERFNGLSLPLQEAHASGCLVIAGDRYPINTWLPTKPLVSPKEEEQLQLQDQIPFLASIYDPVDIAEKIDSFYGKDITKYSLAGKAWAQGNSWGVLKPRYINLIESLI